MNKNIKYIFVDLDGTLIRTDIFLESILMLIKQNPLSVFLIIFWILQGRSVAKDKIAGLVKLNAETLPYTNELIDYLKEQKKKNICIILATASNHTYADAIANHLGIFDMVIASDARKNLKGSNKLAAIRNITGVDEFAYAGNSLADRPIWDAASSNILVNAPRKDIKNAKSKDKAEKIINNKKSSFNAFLRAMRLHQWAKNILIFTPLFTSHIYYEIQTVITATIAFFSFSICASGVYFLNDMLDLEADRLHHKKRFRPLASGELPLPTGIIGAIFLPCIAFVLAWTFLPTSFFFVLLFYYMTTNAYSFFLKGISTADVMTLAILYTLRVVAGAFAINVELSSWLLAFSIFTFVSLAYLKRYIELHSLSENKSKAHGRGYSASDCETMFTLGISNITASVLVLALYINSQEVAGLYKSPKLLWLLCLLMLYWGNRIWIGARRGKISDDPIVFAINDKVSQIIGIGFILVVLSAKYYQF